MEGMFVDHYLPKRLIGLKDEMTSQYLQDNKELKPKQVDLLEKAIACLCYNISYTVSLGKEEFYATLNSKHFSEPLIYNGNEVKRKVSYVWFKRALDWLQEKQLVFVDIGGVEGFTAVGGRVVPEATRNTVIHVSKELVEVFRPVSSEKHIEVLKNVLVLRDGEGCDVPYEVKDHHIKLIELLDLYNNTMLSTDISIGDSKYFIQSSRVFNEDWHRGGRFYLKGAKIMTELLRKDNRDKIRINGEETVHLDYSCMHPSIIGEIVGFTFSEGFSPYSIELPDYDKECLRKIAKLATLILINCASPRQAAMGLSGEMGKKLPLKEWKREGKVPQPVGSKDVIAAVIKHNSYAKEWFGEGRGLELQNIESEIMSVTLDMCLQDGISVIPIHDSLVCGKKYKEKVRQILEYSYNRVLGSKNNCKIVEG